MDAKIMIVSPDEQQEVAVQDREQHGTNTDEKVSKNEIGRASCRERV